MTAEGSGGPAQRPEGPAQCPEGPAQRPAGPAQPPDGDLPSSAARRPRRETRAQREWRPGQTQPPRSVKVLFASVVLGLESVLMFFYALATWGLYQNTDYAWWIFAGCLVLAVALIGTAGLLRRASGFIVGWVLQFWIIATGIIDPFNFMYVVGVIFLACWWYALRKGAQLDREKMERYRAEERLAADHPERPVQPDEPEQADQSDQPDRPDEPEQAGQLDQPDQNVAENAVAEQPPAHVDREENP